MSSDPRWGDDARDHLWDNVQRDRESRERDRESNDPRDAFMRHVDLPRGPNRETVRDRGREYSLRGSETRTLATVGAFRVVPTGKIRDHNNTAAHDRSADIRHLRRDDYDGHHDRTDEEIRAWAAEHDLPYFDEQVHFPDLRIEYEEVDGRREHEDIEVLTVHYRGAHGSAAARSGFSCYGGVTARTGGGRGPDPDIAAELIR